MTAESKRTILRIGLLGFWNGRQLPGRGTGGVGCGREDCGYLQSRCSAQKSASAGAVLYRPTWCGPSASRDVLAAENVDVVVELMGGLDPVEGWLRAAISGGKHVVTANKQLIAFRGAELLALAAEKHVQLLYGAAVAGGVPVIPGIAQGLSGDNITRISGIVNGTCNFILSAMEGGADYGEVLKRAQAAGYAEANPSADVDGFDARAKLCVLARLALHAEIDPDTVPAQTISTIAAIDFAYCQGARLHGAAGIACRVDWRGRDGERWADAGAHDVAAGVVARDAEYGRDERQIRRRCGVQWARCRAAIRRLSR